MMRRMIGIGIAMTMAAACYSGPEIVEGPLRSSYLMVDAETEEPVAGIEARDPEGATLATSDEQGLLDVSIEGEWLEGFVFAMVTVTDPQRRYADDLVYLTERTAEMQNRVPLRACTPELCPEP